MLLAQLWPVSMQRIGGDHNRDDPSGPERNLGQLIGRCAACGLKDASDVALRLADLFRTADVRSNELGQRIGGGRRMLRPSVKICLAVHCGFARIHALGSYNALMSEVRAYPGVATVLTTDHSFKCVLVEPDTLPQFIIVPSTSVGSLIPQHARLHRSTRDAMPCRASANIVAYTGERDRGGTAARRVELNMSLLSVCARHSTRCQL